MEDTATTTGIVMRPTSQEDLIFLEELYGSTRQEELDQVSFWTLEQKSNFISQQFQAQNQYYFEKYTGGHFNIIEIGNKKIGKLYFHENFEDTLRVIDIIIHPDHRFKKIGTQIFEQLFKRAKEIRKNVTIHVESFNPAKQWYERMGFQKISETNGVYHLMQWKYGI